jgi:hypothetical protein
MMKELSGAEQNNYTNLLESWKVSNCMCFSFNSFIGDIQRIQQQIAIIKIKPVTISIILF